MCPEPIGVVEIGEPSMENSDKMEESSFMMQIWYFFPYFSRLIIE